MKKVKIGEILKGLGKGLVRETLQTLPIIGTIVTNFKTETKTSAKGSIQLSKWDIYRLILGLGIAYFLAKGILTEQQIAFIMQYIPF